MTNALLGVKRFTRLCAFSDSGSNDVKERKRTEGFSFQVFKRIQDSNKPCVAGSCLKNENSESQP